MSVANRPRIEAYIGASGSGKGVSVNERLRELRPSRLLIWDTRDEYGAHARGFHSLAELVRAFQKAGGNGIRARFVPGASIKLADAFGIVCKLAFNAGELVFVAEELSDVTTGSHAPAAWRQVITQGRHRGLYVLGCAQRPALIDKTFLGNATFIRCFTLRYDDDRRAMSKALDVPQAEVDKLETVETDKHTTIHYIERDFRQKLLRTGHKRLAR